MRFNNLWAFPLTNFWFLGSHIISKHVENKNVTVILRAIFILDLGKYKRQMQLLACGSFLRSYILTMFTLTRHWIM